MISGTRNYQYLKTEQSLSSFRLRPDEEVEDEENVGSGEDPPGVVVDHLDALQGVPAALLLHGGRGLDTSVQCGHLLTPHLEGGRGQGRLLVPVLAVEPPDAGCPHHVARHLLDVGAHLVPQVHHRGLHLVLLVLDSLGRHQEVLKWCRVLFKANINQQQLFSITPDHRELQ